MSDNPSVLLQLLARRAGFTPGELCASLGGISRATLSRQLTGLGGQIVRLGGSRRIRYARLRPARGLHARLPLYRIDESGTGHVCGQLSLVYPRGSALERAAQFEWPLLDGAMRDGWFDGLPYPLVDMRPQGFLGRHFARTEHSTLGVGDNPERWSDDELVHVLALRGEDQPGNLVLGDVAYQRHLDSRATWETRAIDDAQVPEAYPALALRAMSHGAAGSSAGGEFPKFTAVRLHAGHPRHVLVKFSGSDDSPVVRRWADLLVSEHHALRVLDQVLDIRAATSVLLRHGGRTFIEVERFDRVGAHGRRPLCSAGSLNAGLVGALDLSWPGIAGALRARRWLTEQELERVSRLWWFGRLIANGDMHEGNLSFHPGLALAPVYDMLPMQYAPSRSGELATVSFVPPLALPRERTAWTAAAHAAVIFWKTCADDSRISGDFRATCARNAEAVAQAC